ncbi:uncharacterized protein [Arachis hypogaea]|uniref:uncharacterized protein isoform X2 n=1 Tax=Arachis hypogaea TaxID=3818 RepID=UPI000DEDCA6C|nr:protein MCM10 homolog isoform X2 [Arachis hypogaea]
MSSEEVDLLLSLQDQEKVLETPPASPGFAGYLSDDDRHDGEKPDMSVFRDSVQDCLQYEPNPNPEPSPKPKSKPLLTIDAEVEKFSGLRIRNQLLTSNEIRESFSDIRFVRLSVIKNLLIGDTFSGSWVTVGVLTEKGPPRTSSTGKTYCIWKVGCLDENTVSLFLFGDAYQRNSQEQAGTVFALFNSAVRKDPKGNGFSLSIYSSGQILKMGTSADYGVCKGKRADGMACTLVINKRSGAYCKYHKSKASGKYSTTRTELKGGNAGKVTTKTHSQGIRFLAEVTAKSGPKLMNKGPKAPNEQSNGTDKRKSSGVNVMGSSPVIRNQHLNAKRTRTDEQIVVDKTVKSTGKIIELDFVSSDEDI